jgi:pimeloyl-ACP methyl ester carboxylesterase
MTVFAEPLFFGAAENPPLFGMYHAPDGAVHDGAASGPEPRAAGGGARPRDLAVVLVNPFGYEAICAHRGYRLLAERLARAGFPALRFDLAGTGDSSGDDREPGRVAAWIASIGAAIEEIRARSGVKDVALFGVRLGALLALAAAAERGDVKALALFAPILSGRAYTREMRAFRRMAEKDQAAGPVRGRGEKDEEAAGFLISESTLVEMGKLDALAFDPRGARVLVVARDDVASGEEKLVERLAAKTTAELSTAAGYGALMKEPHNSKVPGPAYDAILAWLEAQSAPVSEPPAHTPPPVVRARVLGDVREELVRFGKNERLLAVLTEAAQGSRSDRPGIVLLNAGAIHRIGPNRTYVSLARRLAGAGYPVLRMDVGGIGDSRPLPGAPDNRVYHRDALVDVDEALDFFGPRTKTTRFILTGLCSGAYVSFHGALADKRVCAAVMINPQTFTWKEGDSLDVSQSKNYNDVQHYQRSIYQIEKWAKLLRGEVDVKRAVVALGRRAKIVGEVRLRKALARFRGTVSPDDVPGTLALLDQRGVRVFFLMSRGDPGLDYLDLHLGSSLYESTPRYRLEIIDGPDHTFTPLWSQTELESRVLGYIESAARAS